ncbi:MAG: TIM barrel protein, partial [Verrucomicrobiales bacterium]|nr:TIM barrel protein [Verrucomicrobiales bacterium]
LDELAATGYVGTELGDWGFMPTEPDALNGELRRRDVALLGAFVPVALADASAHASGEANVLRVARLLAAVHERAKGDTVPFLVLADENGTVPARTKNAGRVTPNLGLDYGRWGTFAEGANRIAAAVRRETGLKTVFHHHCAGYVETPDEIATFLRRTDPALVGLVFDTGHLTFAAPKTDRTAALEALDRFADRIWYHHFKDCHPAVAARSRAEGWDYFTSVKNGVFCELGKGCVDFPAVVRWLRDRGYRGWVLVEQDVLPGMGSPRDSAQRNRDYLKTLGL